jgi:hypothetical protein
VAANRECEWLISPAKPTSALVQDCPLQKNLVVTVPRSVESGPDLA